VISFLDRPKIVRELTARAKALRQEQPEVEEVWLFGSFASGRAVPGSDIDLLILLHAHPQPRWFDRIPDFLKAFADLPFDVDLFPLTRREAAASPVAKEATRSGLQLA
jgi:predicted nucleotidyltransferase